MDVYSKEILEDALKEYTGTVFYVSHDRYFVNQTATRILELEQGSLTEYKGNYDYYMEKKQEKLSISTEQTEQSSSTSTADAGTKLDWKAQKEEQAKARKKANDLKKTEQRIEELETQIAALEEEMAQPEVATNSGKLNELSLKHASLSEELNELYDKWESLA